jgi:hypothetical protein
MNNVRKKGRAVLAAKTRCVSSSSLVRNILQPKSDSLALGLQEPARNFPRIQYRFCNVRALLPPYSTLAKPVPRYPAVIPLGDEVMNLCAGQHKP